jgi:hypothetical protein
VEDADEMLMKMLTEMLAPAIYLPRTRRFFKKNFTVQCTLWHEKQQPVEANGIRIQAS